MLFNRQTFTEIINWYVYKFRHRREKNVVYENSFCSQIFFLDSSGESQFKRQVERLEVYSCEKNEKVIY